MTCRTRWGGYLVTIPRSRSTNRSTIIGLMSIPLLAMAHIAIVICKLVTATPWPIGIWAIDTLLHLFTGCTIPLISPSSGSPVCVPKP